jgi:hypothetical protein
MRERERISSSYIIIFTGTSMVEKGKREKMAIVKSTTFFLAMI